MTKSKSTKSQNTKFTGMYLKLYKNGLKVVTDKENDFWGNKYVKLSKGKTMYWNETKECWFTSKDMQEYLLKNGCQWFSKASSEYKSLSTQKYTDMTLYEHGKGYLLVPKKTHTDYGEKYYNNGWWMKTKDGQHGWFFKKEHFNELMINGVELSQECEDDNEYTYHMEKFGKGYHLKHTSGKFTPSDKYWMGGWWQEKHSAWFFLKEHKDKLEKFVNTTNTTVNDDEKYSDSLSELSDDYEELNSQYFTNMILSEYKNGLLLIPPKKHSDYGQKYYNNGYWNKTLGGWVFKNEHNSFLVDHGAKFS